MRQTAIFLNVVVAAYLASATRADDKVWGVFTGNVVQSATRNNSKWWASTNINPSPVNDSNGHISEAFRNLAGNPLDAVVWSPNPINVASPGRYLVLRFDLYVPNAVSAIEMSMEYQSSNGPLDSTVRKRWWYLTPNLGKQTVILDLENPTIWQSGGGAPAPPLTQHFAFNGYEPWGSYSLVQFMLRTGWWWSGDDAADLAHAGNYCNIDLIAFVDDYSPYVPYPSLTFSDYFVAWGQRNISDRSRNWHFYGTHSASTTTACRSTGAEVQWAGDLCLTGDKKDIISSLYPRIGPYDDFDADVAEYQILTAKSAGFSGFMAGLWSPWNKTVDGTPIYGSNGTPDADDENLMTRTVRQMGQIGSSLGFAVGVDWFPGTTFDWDDATAIGSGYNFATRQQYLDQIELDLGYILDLLYVGGNGPFVNGRPLVPSWDLRSAEAGSNKDNAWLDAQEIIDLRAGIVTQGLPDPRILAVQRDGHTLDSGLYSAVAGFYTWHTLFADKVLLCPWTHYSTRAVQVAFLSDFYHNCDAAFNNGSIHLFMGSFTPRFDSHKALSWDSGNTLKIPDDDGATFTDTLNAVDGSTEAQLLMATTWNDFAEVTVLQPTREYGYRDLDAGGQKLWSRNGWGTYDGLLVRLPERLYQVRKALDLLQDAGVASTALQPASDDASAAATYISNRQRTLAESSLAAAETKVKALKDDLHVHHIDLSWEYVSSQPGGEVVDGLVRQWPTTVTEITAAGKNGVRLSGDATSVWKIGLRTVDGPSGSQVNLVNHAFVGTLTIEYLDANGTEFIELRGDNNDVLSELPPGQPFQTIARFQKKNSGLWRQCQMDVFNTDFEHARFLYDFDVMQNAGGFGGVRLVRLEGLSYGTGAPH